MSAVILDTDPGVDDAMAIAFALKHPDIELLALTTVFGNVSVEQATINALSLLEQFDVGAQEQDIPVVKGAAVPVSQEPLPHPDFVHGSDGMGNIDLPAPKRQCATVSAAEFIVAQTQARPGEITLIAVGPLTNIYHAMKLDPDLPSRVKQLVIMGGAVDEPGNVSPLAEANFLGDPHAADHVLSVEWPAVVVGLDVTHQILLYDSQLAQVRDHAGKTGQILWDSSRFYVNYYTSTGAAAGMPEPGCAMHDAAAVAYVLVPEAFSCIEGASRVVTEGVAAGQLAINRKGYTYLLKHWENRPKTTACMNLDVERVRKLFLETLAA